MIGGCDDDKQRVEKSYSNPFYIFEEESMVLLVFRLIIFHYARRADYN